VKLLRLLQHHTYEPVGSSESVTGDFRLVAATNRDLSEDVRAGRFRRDLYYRLHVCPLLLPPLRERPGDIAPLFFHFWQTHRERRQIAPSVIRHLESYAWPGNVRELENLAERLSVCAEGDTITLRDLPPPFVIHADRPSPCPPSSDTDGPGFSCAGALAELADEKQDTGEIALDPVPRSDVDAIPQASVSESGEITLPVSMATTPLPLPELRLPVDLPRLLREAEEAYIRLALDRAGGNKKEAARLLGMGRTTLVEKLRRKAAAASEKLAPEG
jgi:sigma-54 specific flagellar transcriptional regulator A